MSHHCAQILFRLKLQQIEIIRKETAMKWYRDPQPQVGENDTYLFYLRPNIWARILVQVTIYRRLLIGRDGHLDQSEVYDIS